MSKSSRARAPQRAPKIARPAHRRTSTASRSVSPGLLLALILVGMGVAAFLLWQAFAPRPATAREQFLGLEGTAYDHGSTEALYPDPEQKGAGHRWLPALGREDAPVTIMEFSDFQCGHCQAFNQQELEPLLKDYVATGQARYVVHYYSFSQSLDLAEAGMCAAEQSRYFAFEHALFAGKTVEQAARAAGISDLEAFRACRQEHRYLDTLQNDAIPDAEQMGVNGTPTFFINGQKVEGDKPTQIRQLIETALAEK